MTQPCKYDGKIAELETLIKLNIEHIIENVRLAKTEMDRRLEAMNEFRAQLDNQAKTFMTREAIEGELRRINDKIEILQDNQNREGGAKKWSDHIITVLIGAVVLIIVYFLRT